MTDPTTCRCGHGRGGHRVDYRASQRARRRGGQPTMNLKCLRCSCRNYVGPDGAVQGHWGRPLKGLGARQEV